MSDPKGTKRITISAKINVSITVDAYRLDEYENVEILRVVNMSGLPGVREVIEALDAADDFSQLDEAYDEAGTEY